MSLRVHGGIISITAPALLLAACATPYRTALAPGAAEKLGNTSGVVALQQHEIDTSINPSNLTTAAGGGLIWAIADAVANSHSAKKNENFAAELRQALLDFKFEDTATATLSGRLGETDRTIRLSTVVAALDTTPADISRLVTDAPGDAVAVLFTHYLFNPSFTRVIVTADVHVLAKSESLRPFAKAEKIGGASVPVLYRNRFQSTWNYPLDLPTGGGKREDMVVAWAIEGARPVREALHAACAEIAALLDWDLALPAAEKYTQSGAERLAVSSYQGNAAVTLTGHSVRMENGRNWIRIAAGQLYGEPR